MSVQRPITREPAPERAAHQLPSTCRDAAHGAGRWGRAAAAALAVALLTFAAADADAHDFRLEAGAAGFGTEWRGDGGGYASLKLGVRFADVAGVYVQGSEGYGVVDDRLLTLLAVGGQVWLDFGRFRPHARLGFTHQHEESLSVVANDYSSAIFGIGDGIRHRAGGEAAIGLDIGFWEKEDMSLFTAVDGSCRFFPDELGPKVYAGLGLSLGFNYVL